MTLSAGECRIGRQLTGYEDVDSRLAFQQPCDNTPADGFIVIPNPGRRTDNRVSTTTSMRICGYHGRLLEAVGIRYGRYTLDTDEDDDA